MKRILVCLLTLVFTVSLMAQTSQKSDDAKQKPEQPSAKDDISGMYSFLKDGEFVQINQEDGGILSGFISRFGDDPTDKKTFLDQFFKTGTLKGNEITFTTKVIHGTWFEFNGTVVRGPGKTPNDEGYRLIKGKLVRHKTDDSGKESAESREIEMKSFPTDVDEDE